jgi:UDP-N-acetylglucosamine:LPS N-acetylglucosamine transferase
LERVEAARIIHNKDLNDELLNNEIEDILKTPGVLEKMSQNARTIAVSNVEDKIYEEIKKLVK